MIEDTSRSGGPDTDCRDYLRQCQLCGEMRPRRDLMYTPVEGVINTTRGGMIGTSEFALTCRRGCHQEGQPAVTEMIHGLWCGREVWRAESPSAGSSPGHYVSCGGELLYRRRLEGDRIVSYLICQFCGTQIPVAEVTT